MSALHIRPDACTDRRTSERRASPGPSKQQLRVQVAELAAALYDVLADYGDYHMPRKPSIIRGRAALARAEAL